MPLTETHDLRVFDQWDGLGYLTVSGLAATPDGRLWIATFRDLAIHHPRNGDRRGFPNVGRAIP